MMKVPGLAAAMVGATMLCGSANASYWTISGATAGGVSTGGGRFDIYTELSHHFTANHGPGGNPMGTGNLTPEGAAGVLGSLSLTVASDTLTYFGWVDDLNRGYMGIAFKNTQATAFTGFISGMNWMSGTQGLFSTHGLAFVGYGSGSSISVESNTTFLMVMGGYESGDPQITFNLGSANRNFGVQYMTYDALLGHYTVEASGTGTPSAGSGMNVATYTAEAMISFGPIVPVAVPGSVPVWLAAAAAALVSSRGRRRSAI